MKVNVCLALLALIVAVFAVEEHIRLPRKVELTESDLTKLFIQFRAKFNKVYKDGDVAQRYANFKENMNKSHEMNKKSRAVFGPTKFSDLSLEEFRAKHLMKPKDAKQFFNPNPKYMKKILGEELLADPVPKDFDWRKQGAVTKDKDQTMRFMLGFLSYWCY